MRYVYTSSVGLLAHLGLGISDSNMKYFYVFLAAISFFVFGLLLLRRFFRTPKGLFISAFISYVLVLVNILQLSFGLQISETIRYLCFVQAIS